MKNFLYLFFLFTVAVFNDSSKNSTKYSLNRNPAAVNFEDLKLQPDQNIKALQTLHLKHDTHFKHEYVKKRDF